MYLYKDKAYTLSQLGVELGVADLYSSNVFAEHNIKLLTVVIPPEYNKSRHQIDANDGEVNELLLTFKPSLIERTFFAIIDTDNVVIDVCTDSPEGRYPDGYRMIPVEWDIYIHIKPTRWMLNESGKITPISKDGLQRELIQSAGEFAMSKRREQVKPDDETEVAGWLMNAIGVAFKEAGLDAPVYDEALQAESLASGRSVNDIYKVHKTKARKLHIQFALTQGLKSKAKNDFSDKRLGVDGLIKVANENLLQAEQKLKEAASNGD